MSILIDKLIKEDENQIEINKKWYIAKPLNKPSFVQRVKDAIMVLCGYARAYHYFEDEGYAK